jgi:predicted metal-dependent HD superfamily phosphohydrolase
MATQNKPINKLQEIICDADLDYLGRDDFEEIADNLRKELTEMGKIKSRKEWDEIQVKFLNQHQYFTATALGSRQQKKQENLERVIERLSSNMYSDGL